MPEIAAQSGEAAPIAPWLEVHSENFLGDGGPRLAMLDDIRARYPISCHGVGLSLGSSDGLDREHLARLKRLFDRIEPALISEHLSWSVIDGLYLNDLLPLPYTDEALGIVARNVDQAQSVLGRRLLIENPSAYLSFASSTMPEWEFLSKLVDLTGCGLLLDINNVYVSARNNGGDATGYLANTSADAVGEIHLAGHTVEDEGETEVLVDTHSRVVCDAVWTLYRQSIERLGPRPTLIEWDLELPPLPILLGEAQKAQRIIDAVEADRARAA